MRRVPALGLSCLLTGGLLLATGCEWSGGGDSGFNTSRGAGININWSGVYQGTTGGPAVRGTDIQRLTLNQGGNSVTVIASDGSRYKGSVGSPGAVSSAGSDGSFPAGAELATSQINWTGQDATGNTINFAGILHAVAVTEIIGNTSTRTSSDVSGSDANNMTTTESTVNNGTETITTITTFDGEFAQEREITVNNATGETVNDVTTRTRVTENVREDGQTTQFALTEANTQFRLEGSWIPAGGGGREVDALSRGNASSITTSN